MPILVFLGLFVRDLGLMYATDRQTSDAHHRLMLPPRGGHNKLIDLAAVTLIYSFMILPLIGGVIRR